MDWFGFIKDNYKDGFYTEEDVHLFVELKKITKEQYECITKKLYDIEIS